MLNPNPSLWRSIPDALTRSRWTKPYVTAYESRPSVSPTKPQTFDITSRADYSHGISGNFGSLVVSSSEAPGHGGRFEHSLLLRIAESQRPSDARGDCKMSAIVRPQPRRAHRKSRTGCRNCKIRKIKCDERRPLCRNCDVHYSNIMECEWDLLGSGATQGAAPAPAVTISTSYAQEPSLSNMTIDPELIDPFRTYAPTNAPGVDFLLQYYLSDYVYQCFPFFKTTAVINLWWFFLREDMLLFNSVLQLCCSHLASIGQHNAERRLDVAELGLHSVRLLRERIEQPLQTPSDYTIVATAHFAALEHERNNMRALRAHLDGLVKMISLRGGLDALNSTNPLAASIAFWTGMVVSSEPTILPIVYAQPVSTSCIAIPNPLPQETRSHLDLPIAYRHLLAETDLLSQSFSSTYNGLPIPDSLSTLTALTGLLQRALQMPLYPDDARGSLYIAEASRLAAVLHLCYPRMGAHPDPALLVSAVSQNLKTALSEALAEEAARGQQIADPLRLWLFSVGAVSTILRDARLAGWFLGHLVVICEQLGILSWDEMNKTLASVMSHAVFCEVSFEKVWEAVRSNSLGQQGSIG